METQNKSQSNTPQSHTASLYIRHAHYDITATASRHFRGVPDMVYAGVQNSETLCVLCKARSHLSQGSFASESGCFPPETVWYLVLSLHLVSLHISILTVLLQAAHVSMIQPLRSDKRTKKWLLFQYKIRPVPLQKCTLKTYALKMTSLLFHLLFYQDEIRTFSPVFRVIFLKQSYFGCSDVSSTHGVHGKRSSLAPQLALQPGIYLELIITDMNFLQVD